jgi:hypothetical protein
MKYIVAVTIIIGVALATNLNAQSPSLAFCVKPGMLVNGAHFGYKTDMFFAGVGLEYGSVSVNSKYSVTYSDTTYEDKSKTNASVFLPQLCARVYLGNNAQEEPSIRPYVWLSVFYSIATVKVTYNDQPEIQTEKEIKDLLSGNYGGSLAFGSEYYFSPHFSIGGEFGIRTLFGGTKTTYTSTSYSYTDETNLGLGLTYTALGLNFYF